MSYEGDDEDDAVDGFLKPKRLEDFHAQEQAATPVARNSVRSAADDVIDLLGGVKRPEKRVPTCPFCGGTKFEHRSPLTGPKVSQCTGCGKRSYGAARSSVWMQGSSATHGQGPGGSYYSGPEVAPQNTETHSARFRAKSRSHAAHTDEGDS